MRLLPVVVLASSFLSPAYGAGPIYCTLGMEPSVVVTVVDSNGNIQSDASVTFTVDGEPLPYYEEGCYSGYGTYPQYCDQWYGGLERLGLFHVTAVGSNGASVSMDVPVTVMGQCHVETQDVTLVLP